MYIYEDFRCMKISHICTAVEGMKLEDPRS